MGCTDLCCECLIGTSALAGLENGILALRGAERGAPEYVPRPAACAWRPRWLDPARCAALLRLRGLAAARSDSAAHTRANPGVRRRGAAVWSCCSFTID